MFQGHKTKVACSCLFDFKSHIVCIQFLGSPGSYGYSGQAARGPSTYPDVIRAGPGWTPPHTPQWSGCLGSSLLGELTLKVL